MSRPIMVRMLQQRFPQMLPQSPLPACRASWSGSASLVPHAQPTLCWSARPTLVAPGSSAALDSGAGTPAVQEQASVRKTVLDLSFIALLAWSATSLIMRPSVLGNGCSPCASTGAGEVQSKAIGDGQHQLPDKGVARAAARGCRGGRHPVQDILVHQHRPAPLGPHHQAHPRLQASSPSQTNHFSLQATYPLRISSDQPFAHTTSACMAAQEQAHQAEASLVDKAFAKAPRHLCRIQEHSCWHHRKHAAPTSSSRKRVSAPQSRGHWSSRYSSRLTSSGCPGSPFT